MGKQRVPRTRNNGTQTESQYWSMVRSALRSATRYWKPAQEAKLMARHKYKGKGRQKWEYQCAECEKWFKEKDIQIDHKIPAGSLRCGEELNEFLDILTSEIHDSYQILCKECHKVKTLKEKKK